MVLARLDLGALALCVVWHALAFRFSPAIDGWIVCGVVLHLDDGGCCVVHDFSDPSVDLGGSAYWHLHRRDDFNLCSWRPDYCGGGEEG